MTSDLLFPSGTTSGVLQGSSKLVPKLLRSPGITIGLHDLRRTCRSLMSREGASEEVAELAIGHRRKALIGFYNRDDAWRARVDAFERVSAAIETIMVKKASEISISIIFDEMYRFRSSRDNSIVCTLWYIYFLQYIPMLTQMEPEIAR